MNVKNVITKKKNYCRKKIFRDLEPIIKQDQYDY